MLQPKHGKPLRSRRMPVIQALHIRQNRLLATAQRAQVGRCHGAVAAVAHGHHQYVHGMLGIYGLQVDAVFVADFARVGELAVASLSQILAGEPASLSTVTPTLVVRAST